MNRHRIINWYHESSSITHPKFWLPMLLERPIFKLDMKRISIHQFSLCPNNHLNVCHLPFAKSLISHERIYHKSSLIFFFFFFFSIAFLISFQSSWGFKRDITIKELQSTLATSFSFATKNSFPQRGEDLVEASNSLETALLFAFHMRTSSQHMHIYW